MIFAQAYEDALFLPFNHTCVAEHFVPGTPDTDPGGTGVWVILHNNHIYVQQDAEGIRLPQSPSTTLPTEIITVGTQATATHTFYCGQWDNLPCRVCFLPTTATPPANLTGLTGYSLRREEPDLDLALISMGVLAKHLHHWLGNSRFCSSCGAPMRPIPVTWGMECCGCGQHHFPHIHPCAIVLVQREDKLLLTRKPTWEPGRYSHSAGFMEPGENLEETAYREVLEETGIHIRNIRYCGSQAWPFPSQLMAGFIADYASGTIQIQRDELEDAAWFSASKLPILPSRRSISRFLIDLWLKEQGLES
ncbi:MAG: NAD(+) diphosphatase [Desulfuromonadaceae bacterium]|nr:NAD(+) diphosphatase [Desulfuromonadaceae bacterium]